MPGSCCCDPAMTAGSELLSRNSVSTRKGARLCGAGAFACQPILLQLLRERLLVTRATATRAATRLRGRAMEEVQEPVVAGRLQAQGAHDAGDAQQILAGGE